MPLELTRAITFNVTPVFTLETVWANGLVPFSWTPPATAWEVRVATDWPTFMVAGMLSVAINEGAEIMRDLPVLSWAVSIDNSSRLWPTRRPPVIVNVCAAVLARKPPGVPGPVNPLGTAVPFSCR